MKCISIKLKGNGYPDRLSHVVEFDLHKTLINKDYRAKTTDFVLNFPIFALIPHFSKSKTK